jgi:hypothetical protein
VNWVLEHFVKLEKKKSKKKKSKPKMKSQGSDGENQTTNEFAKRLTVCND